MILFLDDDPHRAALTYKRWPTEKRDNTIWAMTAEEAITTLRDYDLEEAHLDHDLGGEKYQDTRREDCGMEVVRWIERQEDISKFRSTFFVCHSWNIGAGLRMVERLKDLGLKAEYIPFGTKK